MAKAPAPVKQASPSKASPENIAVAEEILGVSFNAPPDLFMEKVVKSISSSPYTSAEMLEDYVRRGMPEVKDRALDAIDEERRWRHAREEQEQNHRHEMDRGQLELAKGNAADDQAVRRRSQRNAFKMAVSGVILALVAGYFGVPTSLCIAVVVLAVGGPSTASVFARFAAKYVK